MKWLNSQSVKRLCLVVVILAGVAIVVAKLGNFPLRNWDEAWYAEISKNMGWKDYGWLMPYWNGRYYFDHPPLYFWLSGLVVKVFGLGEWQVRIVSIAAGLGVIKLIYLLGKKLFNLRVGILASLIFVTLAQVVMRLAYGNLEALMLLLFLVTIYVYLISEGRLKWMILGGVSLGLGFLVKGWLQGLFPVVFIGLFALVTQKKLPVGALLIMTVMGAIILGTWFGLGARNFGQPFVERYLVQPAAGRLNNPLDNFSLRQFERVMMDVKWWLIPTATLLWWLVKKKVLKSDTRKLAVVVVMVIGFIGALSFVDEKSGWYTLPAYPLVALVVGYSLDKWWRVSPTLTVVATVMLVVAGGVNAYRIENIYPDRSKVGVALGKYTKTIIPRGETVILDDHDFTAWLFYSDLDMVYVTENDGPKPGEWWILRYEEVAKLIGEKGLVWIITTDENRFPAEVRENINLVEEYQGYKFFKIESN